MNPPKKFLRSLLPVALLFAVPANASAHSAISGVGDFFGGVLHPLTTPTHLLILLGLGLLVGQKTPLNLKLPLQVFIPVSAIALALTTTGFVNTIPTPWLIGLALVIGLLVALSWKLPLWVSGALFGAAALLIGLDSPAESATWSGTLKTLLGIWVGLILGVGDIAYFSSLCTRHHWQQTGLRVTGSWISAIALMVLAFALRK